MDKVEENFRRATKVDAVTKEKFYFRTNIFDSGPPVIEELTLDEIFFGSSNSEKPVRGLICSVGINKYFIYQGFLFGEKFYERNGRKCFCCDKHYKNI